MVGLISKLFFLLTSLIGVFSSSVSFDGRAFSIDGQPIMFVAGSVHYPRAPRSEWPTILAQAKANGINLIEAYVFWDIHEPQMDQWNFPSDPSSSEDLVGFIQEAGKLGLYVHLRISGYICAEWNFGGFPVWLKDLNVTLRTFNTPWLDRLTKYVEKTVDVVKSAGLLAPAGGPIVMLQIENEYGNMENYYGEDGHKYVQWIANWALALDVGVPWVMCQQGEGVGTAPPAEVVNACNGFYCDNWISGHASAFPNQPHMWTENWPGWFQNWGEPVPHRPAVDVAFAVARWFARGGTYMNYYMAFGGTNFGRSVGGPLIVTSYDYDVQINEYAMRAEPKFSLLSDLHGILFSESAALLGQYPPAGVPLANHRNCESHTYTAPNSDSCIQFLSNYDERETCKFSTNAGDVTVLPWSVSIVNGPGCSNLVYNTKTSSGSVQPANKLHAEPITDVKFSSFEKYAEPIPSVAQKPVAAGSSVYSDFPIEQLSLTKDSTDYLWYSTIIPTQRSAAANVTLSYVAGSAGGAVMFIYVDSELVATTLGAAGEPPIVATSRHEELTLSDYHFPVKVTFPLPAGGNNRLDILSASMGLKNYGPYLETIEVGVLGSVKVDDVELKGFTHTIGLVGETERVAAALPTTKHLTALKEDADCSKLCWYRAVFNTPASIRTSNSADAAPTPLALDLGASMGKGAAWVNGHMIGRYWNITANANVNQAHCDSVSCQALNYVGGYNGDKCRTGCGAPSQQYYKVPAEWLHASDSGLENTIVLFDELGGNPNKIQFVEMSMVNV